MRLVNNWKSFWRWYSTQSMMLAISIPFAWEQLPQDLKEQIPQSWIPYITAAVLLGGILGRVVDQSKSEV